MDFISSQTKLYQFGLLPFITNTFKTSCTPLYFSGTTLIFSLEWVPYKPAVSLFFFLEWRVTPTSLHWYFMNHCNRSPCMHLHANRPIVSLHFITWLHFILALQHAQCAPLSFLPPSRLQALCFPSFSPAWWGLLSWSCCLTDILLLSAKYVDINGTRIFYAHKLQLTGHFHDEGIFLKFEPFVLGFMKNISSTTLFSKGKPLKFLAAASIAVANSMVFTQAGLLLPHSYFPTCLHGCSAFHSLD